MAIVTRKCQKCGRAFQAHSADVKRGWARCCSKSCAASMREKRLNRGRVWEASDGDTYSESMAPGHSDYAVQW